MSAALKRSSITSHELRDYQADLLSAAIREWNGGARNVLAVLPTGGGKCLGRGTPVMLYSGHAVPVEDVRVGDRLMGPDSRPRRVLSLARGREAMYRVTPNKGDSYVVNESHVLSLRRTGVKGTPLYPCQVGGGVVNLTVADYLARSNTFKHEHKGWRAAVNFQRRRAPLPIDPYFLGLWLGDGNSKDATITSGDSEIVEWLESHAARLGMCLASSPNSPNSRVYRTQTHARPGRGGSPLLRSLRSIGVLHNKHVPHAYKTASRNDRLALLAGLIDSDGYYCGKGFQLTLGDEALLDAAIFVARSLGLSAYKRACQKTCHNNGVVGNYWACSISGDIDQVPCLVTRKRAAPRRQKKDVLVTGIRVEPIGEGDYFGFEIDGDRLFLLGDFTVTHNTVCFAYAIANHPGAAVAIAHRSELVTQMSLALAREGVRHRVVGPAALGRACSKAHMDELGRLYTDPNARCAVAGVDSLVRLDPSDPWFAQVTLWVQDEAHHVLTGNKWGDACAMFPNARGLGVTATPVRADGKGLGRHADGLMDAMVVGPTMRELIERDFLTDYRIFAPPSDLDLTQVTTSGSGDYSPPKLKAARRASHITGDVVAHYLRIAPGKLGITFDTDVESATETAAAFRAAGVPAEVVSSKSHDEFRASTLRKFRNREVLQLVNVDLFGEGFDLPAIEVVSMARPTQSYGLYCQQFGRALRPLAGKDRAIIIDHVGNVARHGLPDAYREWSLDRRERTSRTTPSDAIPVRTCLNPECMSVYERIYSACPFCGFEVVPASRSAPEFVDGDLFELDPATLALLRGEKARIDGDVKLPYGATPAVAGAIRRTHWERQQGQAELREGIALWAGWQNTLGRADPEVYRRFYFKFGVDILTAQTLGAREAAELSERVRAELTRHSVTSLEENA